MKIIVQLFNIYKPPYPRPPSPATAGQWAGQLVTGTEAGRAGRLPGPWILPTQSPWRPSSPGTRTPGGGIYTDTYTDIYTDLDNIYNILVLSNVWGNLIRKFFISSLGLSVSVADESPLSVSLQAGETGQRELCLEVDIIRL